MYTINAHAHLLQVPPGGAMIGLQVPRGECFTKPRLDNATPKPECLSMVEDSRWTEFEGHLASIVSMYWTENFAWALYLPIVVVLSYGFLFIYFLAGLDMIVFVPIGVSTGLFVLGFAGVIYFLCWMAKKNCALDEQIHELCEGLKSSLGGEMTVEYRTRNTTLSKPKGASTARLIVFGPKHLMPLAGMQLGMQFGMQPGMPMHPMPMAGVSPMPIMVTVPPGVQPGQQMQVPTAMGIQIVTVPEGLLPGQSFNYCPQAMPVQVQPQNVGNSLA